MNKTELIAAVAEKAELSKKDAEAAITAMVDAITEALSQEEKVQLVGFGSFEVKTRAARVGRNPKTGEEIPISEARLQDPRVQGRQGSEGRRQVIKKQKTGTQRKRSRFCYHQGPRKAFPWGKVARRAG